jgi:16S rRNA U1498 N3-methylase RsmE
MYIFNIRRIKNGNIVEIITSEDARWKCNAQSKSKSFGKLILLNADESRHVFKFVDII